MCLVAACLLTLTCHADITRQRAVVVGMEEVVDGSLIHLLVANSDGTCHAETVDDGSPIAVGIGGVGLELVHGGHHRPTKHRFPFTLLCGRGAGGEALLNHHRPTKPITLNQA